MLLAVVDIYTRSEGLPTFLSVVLARLMSAYFWVTILAAPTFLVWIHRARVRQRWFLDRYRLPLTPPPDVSPWRAVGVWFVPVASLWLPYQEVEDMFHLEPSEPADENPLLPMWWGCFIAGGAASAFFNRAAGLERAAEQPISEGWLWLNVRRYALLFVAAVLAIRWISEFERRTARRTTPQTETATTASSG